MFFGPALFCGNSDACVFDAAIAARDGGVCWSGGGGFAAVAGDSAADNGPAVAD